MSGEVGTKAGVFHNEQQVKNNYLNNYDFLKRFSEFNAQLKDKQQQQHQHVNFSASKSQKSNKSTKSRSKTTHQSKAFQQQPKSNNKDIITIGRSIH